jgi:formamidopyrimidine-DNA glycosylase
MPEIPEVETTVRALRKPLIGRTITAVRNTWPRHLANLTLPEMQHRLHNQRIEAITRRAKYLVFSFARPRNPHFPSKNDRAFSCHG